MEIGFPSEAVSVRRLRCLLASEKIIEEKYGDKLTFWGGGVDTQHTLPFGTPEEVRRQVLERLEMLSKGGGYVFNTIHNIVAGVPTENLMAMYKAVHDFNGD